MPAAVRQFALAECASTDAASSRRHSTGIPLTEPPFQPFEQLLGRRLECIRVEPPTTRPDTGPGRLGPLIASVMRSRAEVHSRVGSAGIGGPQVLGRRGSSVRRAMRRGFSGRFFLHYSEGVAIHPNPRLENCVPAGAGRSRSRWPYSVASNEKLELRSSSHFRNGGCRVRPCSTLCFSRLSLDDALQTIREMHHEGRLAIHATGPHLTPAVSVPITGGCPATQGRDLPLAAIHLDTAADPEQCGATTRCALARVATTPLITVARRKPDRTSISKRH